jgi:hypothetical protein
MLTSKTIGNAFAPKNKTKNISRAKEIKIQVLLLKKLSITYPINGFTNHAKIVKLFKTIIFSGEK